MSQQDFSTLAIHAGTQPDEASAAISPLYDSTTFAFTDTQALLDVMTGTESGNFYSRYGMNPTIRSLEQRLAALDGAENALAYASGMAAISSVCLAFGRDGIICLGEIYGGTTSFLQQQASALGIETQYLAVDDMSMLQAVLKQGASMVFVESPANPTLAVCDITEIARVTHSAGARLVVDNTFASPINQQPLALGADISLQSATKYLGGHSDLTAGVVAGCQQDINVLNSWRKSLGQTIAPEVAHKLKRSLMTLPLRIERHNQNAQQLANFLNAHAAVEKVYYPGLEDFAGHQLARSQMQGFGGMLSFTLKGDASRARQIVDALKLIKLAPSLGGAETLATQPVFTSHYGVSQQTLAKAGIDESMIRLSVGLESTVDLIADLEQALEP